MNILKDPQTNWKYIAGIAVLGLTVSAGVVWYQWWHGKQGQEISTPETTVKSSEVEGITPHSFATRILQYRQQGDYDKAYGLICDINQTDVTKAEYIDFMTTSLGDRRNATFQIGEIVEHEIGEVVYYTVYVTESFPDKQSEVGITLIEKRGQDWCFNSRAIPIIQGIVVDTPISITEIVSDWQTYRNEALGFEVKYPGGWEYKKDDSTYGDTLGISFRFGPSLTQQFVEIEIFDAELNETASQSFQRITNLDTSGIVKTKILIPGIGLVDYYKEIPGHVSYNEVLLIDKNRFYGIQQFFIDDEIFNTILSTFKFIEPQTLSTTCIDEPEDTPVIASISPTSGPVGTEVTIMGCNLSGFEGDLDTVFVRSDGAEIPIYGGLWCFWCEEEYWSPLGEKIKASQGMFMKVTIGSYCESGYETGRYSGITSPCETIEAIPGVYKVYVTAWGKRSNEATFTIE